MANISTIKLPNGNSYDLKDKSAIATITGSGNTITYTTRGGTSGSFELSGGSSSSGSASGDAVELILSASNWSSSTTAVNGNTYYTYSVTSVTDIGNPHPTVICSSTSGTLPSDIEAAAFSAITYVTVDTSTSKITFYAEAKPATDIILIVADYLADDVTGTTETVTITTSNWSSATTTVNGSAYYTCKKTLTSVASAHPTVICGTADTLPSDNEQDAFGCIKWVTVDTSTNVITFYALQKPSASAVVTVL